MKLNVALRRFPSFTAAPRGVEPQRAQVTITDGVDAVQARGRVGARGGARDRLCELYFQSAYDRHGRPRRAAR